MAPVIHCCVCLNLSGDTVAAITVINGYAACEKHVAVVSSPGFDIFALRKEKRQA